MAQKLGVVEPGCNPTGLQNSLNAFTICPGKWRMQLFMMISY